MYRTTQETQARKDAKRQRLLYGAAKVFAEHGYHSAGVKDVAERAGVSVGTFYFYFKSKEELFAALCRSTVEELDAAAACVVDTARFERPENAARLMTATLWLCERRRGIVRLLLLEDAAGAQTPRPETDGLRELARTLAAWLERIGLPEGAGAEETRLAALLYAGSCCALVGGRGAPDARSGAAFCAYHLRALGLAFEEEALRETIAEALRELERAEQERKGTEMNTDRKKELKKEYRNRAVTGGVCCTRCSGSGRMWIQATRNLDAFRNRFDFAMKTKSCPDPVLRADWAEYGAEAFSLTVLEALEKGEEQTDRDFAADIQLLYEMWMEKSRRGEL